MPACGGGKKVRLVIRLRLINQVQAHQSVTILNAPDRVNPQRLGEDADQPRRIKYRKLTQG